MTIDDRKIVMHYIVEDHAKRQPDKAFLVTRERRLTYAETDALANSVGRGFASLGVTKGDRVLVMMPSGIDFFLVWLGLCKIGALMCPMNEAYVKRMLAHQASDCGARHAVIAQGYLDRWMEVAEDLPDLQDVIVCDDGEPGCKTPWMQHEFTVLFEQSDDPLPPVVRYFDPMAVFYTSGTTGPSKGVLYPYAQAHATAAGQAALCDPDDVHYMCAPMFHVGLVHLAGIPLIAGATLAIRPKFSATEFWDDIRYFGATMTLIITAMPAFLLAQPESDDDREHPLKKVIMAPLVGDVGKFKRRFGIEKVATLFNMTEVSCPLQTGFELPNGRTCGRPRAGVIARIVNEYDEEVPNGEVGELVLRSENPWEFNLGYWKKPEKTAEAWHNQWLHTGDLLSRDDDGYFYFHDRLKDAIRRRGENISSYEIEREVDAHPAVRESAAVAVESPFGEQEVKIVVSLTPGAELSPEALSAFLAEVLPLYMRPRYIDMRVDELPKTPTGKIQKQTLRDLGTKQAWDAEAKK
ncbi:crotonobetaine/carnitine-CoA ligase [Salinihabitans flavidus]|uniref:Crotonobetaine/carnitine-CoA ligase n=1 Tax=Salinihabitans flavidus TaxID=569882 RepID=A0A1H8UPC9_9RHOB|nr:AMP-binding protein [Salinihabitans flavidus]SEP04833.1 crotonobetaine/carnitine-CoA ligase [Salinihabitans flavidus]